MSRIFITGGTGFIGTYLVNHLSQRGHDLTLLTRSMPTLFMDGRPKLPQNIAHIEGTLKNLNDYYDSLSSCDVVIHLGADYRIGIPNTKKARTQMYEANVEGTLILADAALKAGIGRFIYASTTAALGETHGAFPDERSRHNAIFRCYYEETKHIAHELLKQREQRGLPLVMAVLGGVFGEGDASALTKAMQDYIQGKLKIQPDSHSRFQLCHVRYIVDAFDRLLHHPNPDSSYLLTGNDYSMPEIFAMLAGISSQPEPKKIDVPKLKTLADIMDFLNKFGMKLPLNKEVFQIMDGSTYTYSSQKAETELGWSKGDPTEDLREYMQFLVEQFTCDAKP